MNNITIEWNLILFIGIVLLFILLLSIVIGGIVLCMLGIL